MGLDSFGGGFEEAKEELPANTIGNRFKANKSEVGILGISTSRKALLSDKDSSTAETDKLRIIPSRLKLLKISSSSSLGSPSAKFRKLTEERDEMSRSVPSTTNQVVHHRFGGLHLEKIDWSSVWDMCSKWVRNPYNMALLLWITCVAVSGAILFLVMTGMLNSALPKKSQRNTWFEVNNQILNALFTLMCLYQHPKRFYHLVLLCRWRQEDIVALRKVYCKNGTYKPNEWAHMMVVVVLYHINCFAQYALCGLNLGYKRSQRPALAVGICISIAIGAPAMAGVYSIVSPLGREYDSKFDEEAQNQNLSHETNHPNRRKSIEKRFSFASKNELTNVEYAPVWRGGLFDIWDDIVVAYLSLFCSFCVFGWNMERLGFGNMYVHIATFLLFCTSPFWIFNLAAINIDNDFVRQVLGLTGIVLCLFGLLYGGFWRIQMRKRFNLPGNTACFGKPDIADCTLWLFCCWCSLAQEVRTADFYDIVEDKFCRKETEEINLPKLSPLPREEGLSQFRYNPTSPLRENIWQSSVHTESSSSPNQVPGGHYTPDRHHSKLAVEYSAKDKEYLMKPPDSLSMQKGDYSHKT
ncbi:hypothetical protein K2173_000033 [Erythroxylum novogranatense]|uniref:PLAC8 motif-containing protein n=1 Tax=Erythroxylum novogranatense TaxID=1862640 RepID=A0AAV8SPB5_9ROSI|nr:hypothetical protein K2173_000033 [Erythroxylum novogranatense]